MLIIDADLYVYKVGFRNRAKEIGFKLISREGFDTVDLGNISLTKAKEIAEKDNYLSDEWRLVHYDNPTSLQAILDDLDGLITGLLLNAQNPEYKMFLTSSDYSNYRFGIATIKPYKGSRSKCVKCFERVSAAFDRDLNVVLTCKHCGEIPKDCTFSDKPHHYAEIREHLIKKWNAELVYGQEADDACSILQCELSKQGIESTLVCIDKDLNNNPGWKYNPDKQERYWVSPEDALKNFYTQFLLGDNIDCIPGVAGCGKVYASKLLEGCLLPCEYESVIMDVYQGENIPIKGFKNKMNLTPEEAYARMLEVGQLLHIRQQDNEMWKPVFPLE